MPANDDDDVSPALVSSHAFLVLAALLRARRYPEVTVRGQLAQYLLSLAAWTWPRSPVTNWADRACAAGNIVILGRAHARRSAVPPPILVSMLLFTIGFKVTDCLSRRNPHGDVTPWYLAWHANLLLWNAVAAALPRV